MVGACGQSGWKPTGVVQLTAQSGCVATSIPGAGVNWNSGLSAEVSTSGTSTGPKLIRRSAARSVGFVTYGFAIGPWATYSNVPEVPSGQVYQAGPSQLPPVAWA